MKNGMSTLMMVGAMIGMVAVFLWAMGVPELLTTAMDIAQYIP